MDRSTSIKALTRRLSTLPRDEAVEAVYLLVAYFSHKLSMAHFLARADAMVRFPYQRRAVDQVLEMVSEIEEREGLAIAELPDEVSRWYIRAIAELPPRGSRPTARDRKRVEADLAELRKVV